ncbi:hypothetical protein DFH07DRAFT_766978 [Mycena maculata]|uniref:Uncharacterized protein n=1 Tax=Mycena maculata TaxID=230809 RepID=A0AAD7NUT2_9AGAR|nr:hypothetical protein DFH07DRAFT_766978 [Mycena maculata]
MTDSLPTAVATAFRSSLRAFLERETQHQSPDSRSQTPDTAPMRVELEDDASFGAGTRCGTNRGCPGQNLYANHLYWIRNPTTSRQTSLTEGGAPALPSLSSISRRCHQNRAAATPSAFAITAIRIPAIPAQRTLPVLGVGGIVPRYLHNVH